MAKKKVSVRKDTMKQMLQYVKKHSLFVILSILFAAVSVALTLYVHRNIFLKICA